MINDVLDLVKVEAGRLDVHPVPVNPATLVAEVCAVLNGTLTAKNLDVRADIDAALVGVELDPSRFKQVLYNYLSNAAKFTPAGGKITVRVSREPAEDMLRIEVIDTGIGIAASDLGDLFVEFQQLDVGAAKRHAGTGLGLVLTKRVVEAQGGTVGVRSQPGKGSRCRGAARGVPDGRPRQANWNWSAPHRTIRPAFWWSMAIAARRLWWRKLCWAPDTAWTPPPPGPRGWTCVSATATTR
jgi:signal transduction histidine kinase